MGLLFPGHFLKPPASSPRTLLQGRGMLKLFFPTTAMLSPNDICPGKELISPRLNVYVPNTCSSAFVHQLLKQERLVLNQNVGKEPPQGEKPGCVQV